MRAAGETGLASAASVAEVQFPKTRMAISGWSLAKSACPPFHARVPVHAWLRTDVLAPCSWVAVDAQLDRLQALLINVGLVRDFRAGLRCARTPSKPQICGFMRLRGVILDPRGVPPRFLAFATAEGVYTTMDKSAASMHATSSRWR